MDFQLGPGPLEPEFEQLKSDIGIVENGDTATHAIPSGYYVIWKGDLYVARTDISSGTALSSASGGNLTAKTQGLGADVATINTRIASKDFQPSNGDSLLTWLIANIPHRGTLPFTFVKVGNATMSDTPFTTSTTEFEGVVFGFSDRLVVELNRYGAGGYEKWVRTIYQSNWYGGWEAYAKKSDIGNMAFKKVNCSIARPTTGGSLSQTLSGTFAEAFSSPPTILGLRYQNTWGSWNAYGTHIKAVTTTGFNIDMTFDDQNVVNNVQFSNVYAIVEV